MDMDKNNFSSEQPLCSWCNIPLNLNNSFEKSVCVDCYRKLIKAGFSDEKIFKRKNPTASENILIFTKSLAS
jgi:hypothetical protein